MLHKTLSSIDFLLPIAYCLCKLIHSNIQLLGTQSSLPPRSPYPNFKVSFHSSKQQLCPLICTHHLSPKATKYAFNHRDFLSIPDFPVCLSCLVLANILCSIVVL
ncbi:hypothetical protein I7I50_07421 [Histoplasma capsulatum G186AR]|uniref:Uncharacterized protein n=1 Tax=Ajellomyces capsulatus TaxID=5037 RepID=A0A8H8D2J5_AJECA|nr:hypothetical protein I7I52_09507 [Histoplasma capsulatum]QSS68125.1 hypothetical protein I7I50_07421 [Histoplasma capsulatum G186AR]